LRLKQRVVWVLLAAIAAGCSVAAPDGELIPLSSGTPRFIDELLDSAPIPEETVYGRLMTPGTAPPWPAIVLLHSASGQGAIDWSYAADLTEAGFAVLAIDSFSSRGVFRTVDDQTKVSASAMVLDAFSGREALAADPRIDADRIGVVGFSKGGIAALYAAVERISSAAGGEAFSVHAAHYPWCGLRLLDPSTTGAPILVQIGADDTVTPARLCLDMARDIGSVDPHASVDVIVYPDARHAFDHPALAVLGWVPVTGMIPGDCLIEEEHRGRFVEVSTGQVVTGSTLADVLKACGRQGAEAGGNDSAAIEARRRLLSFLSEALDP